MKTHTFREMTRAELVQKRDELTEELFNLKMRRSIKTLENPLRLRTIGREIARINTVLREDELSIRSLAEGKLSILGAARSGKSAEK
ncbi:MAG: 50S ribosomal protein L29 [candidate division Zixibacteria bacterium]|nr:50S ribosomal protein L29 [candidate division Zixibacteria bacterium]